MDTNVTDLSGRKAVVRNGFLPAREVLTALGPVAVRVPKVRDRSGSGVKFNSAIVPPYVRKARRVEVALPWLYLRGISTGDMQEALTVLLGADAKGLSPAVVSRLKAQWSEDYLAWNLRDLSGDRYVYVWADGIYSALRGEDDRLCRLVLSKPSALPSVICRAALPCFAFCARMSDGDIEPLEAAHGGLAGERDHPGCVLPTARTERGNLLGPVAGVPSGGGCG